ETGIDRGELRRRNFIVPEEMPHATQTGWTYDTGDYATAMDKCQAMSDWDGYEARKAESEARGMIRGRGLV
ncbi:MAG: hypothetical protein VW169_16920, partial [Rhodospirillaceae bacterium]